MGCENARLIAAVGEVFNEVALRSISEAPLTDPTVKRFVVITGYQSKEGSPIGFCVTIEDAGHSDFDRYVQIFVTEVSSGLAACKEMDGWPEEDIDRYHAPRVMY